VRKIKLALLPIIAIISVLGFSLPAAAATTTASPTAANVTASTNLHAVEYHITTKYGTLTYGWRPLTTQAKSTALTEAPKTGTVTPPTPDSAYGCNQNVCISLEGSGLHVSDWSSQATYEGSIELCTQSYFYENDAEIRSGTSVCGEAGVFFTDWAANKNFPNNAKLCNQWKKIAGEPCETVHS
jgi:hypothetical protein